VKKKDGSESRDVRKRRDWIFDEVGIVHDIPVIRYGGKEKYEEVREKYVRIMPEVARLYVEFLQLRNLEIKEVDWVIDLSSLKSISTDYEMASSTMEAAPSIEEVVEFAEEYVNRENVSEDVYPRENKYPYAIARSAWPPEKEKHEIIANYRGGVRDALDLIHEYGHVAQYQRIQGLHQDVEAYKDAIRNNGFIAAETAAIAVELKFYKEKELAETGESLDKAYLINVPRYEFERRALEAVQNGTLTPDNSYEFLVSLWRNIKKEYFSMEDADGREIDPLQLPHPFSHPGKNIGYVAAYLVAQKAVEDEELFNNVLDGKYSEEELIEIAGLKNETA
jgi:oligoendopeptidase F